MQTRNKKVDIIGVQLSDGAGIVGIEMGARAIRHAGLYDAISGLGYEFRDHGDIAPDCQFRGCEGGKDCCGKDCGDNAARCASGAGKGSGLLRLAGVNEVNTKLYNEVRQTLKDGGFPLVLGGDHALAAGSITAAADHFGKIGVIWVDAHGDYNSAESSPTGNIHGMPLSAVTGNGPVEIIPFKEKDAQFVSTKNAVLLGVRSIDEGERERIKAAGVTAFSMEDIDREGIHAIVKKAVEIASEGTQGVYLSFDCDGADPIVAPGVSTPVEGGLTSRESNYVCEYIAANANLVGAEIVECNPIRDHGNRTGEFAVSLAMSILGKTIM